MGAAVGGVIFAHKRFKMKDDNFIEEIAESVIKNETGIDIDLTPDTIEQQESKEVKSVSFFVSDQLKKLG